MVWLYHNEILIADLVPCPAWCSWTSTLSSACLSFLFPALVAWSPPWQLIHFGKGGRRNTAASAPSSPWVEASFPIWAEIERLWSWWDLQMAQGNRILWGMSPITRGGRKKKGSLHTQYHSSLYLHGGRKQCLDEIKITKMLRCD